MTDKVTPASNRKLVADGLGKSVKPPPKSERPPPPNAQVAPQTPSPPSDKK